MDVTVALALHVAAIVVWIGGVAMVTTVILPAVRRTRRADERVQFFEAVEGRFAWVARGATLVAAASGFYMMERLDLWRAFPSAAFWWLDAMVFVWLVFTLMLFVAEPLFLGRWLRRRAEADPQGTFRIIERLHWFLLTISMITVLGAVAGVGGLTFG